MNSDRDYTYIQLNSGDPSIQSYDTAAAQSFSNVLPVPIILDGNRDYECCLLSTQFYNNQPLPDESYYQPLGTLDGVTYTTTVPNQLVKRLVFT